MTTTLLDASGLNAWYGAAQILYDVALHVDRGEVVALMGRNGAGKSTTLKALMGLLAKRKGKIAFLGQDVSTAQPHEVARLGLGYVPEDRRVFADLSVTENLEVGRPPPRALDRRQRRAGLDAGPRSSNSSRTSARCPTAPAAG